MNKIEKGLSRIIGRAIRKNDAGRKDIGIYSLVEDTVKEAIEFLDSEDVVRKDRRYGMDMDTRGGYNWKEVFFVTPLIKEESDDNNEVS